MRVINKGYFDVISLGAGKQSSYMLLTALEGAYKHKPDLAIFSDTGCEPKYVYDYLEWITAYVKEKYNFDIITVKKGDMLADIHSYLDGDANRASQLPFYLGSGGIIMRQCTIDYKIQPLRKELQKRREGRKVRMWIGISLDEIERMKTSQLKYIENYYPLIENRITIDGIIHWFSQNGIKEPGKSACLICPFHTDNYWRRVKKEYPKEFEDACVFDDKIREYPKLKSKAYLSNHRMPLRGIDFTYQPSLFPELIEECDGFCGL